MRDYVFYPFALTKPMQSLSKSLKKKAGADFARALPAALGNVLVFLLVGIWHGATGNYVLWGLYNGLILAFSALMEPRYKRFGENHAALVKTPGFHVLRVLRTFLIVNIGWYFDRALRAGDAFAMMAKSVTQFDVSEITLKAFAAMEIEARDLRILAVGTLILFVVSFVQERGYRVRDTLLDRFGLPARWAVLLAFIMFVLATFVTVGTSSGFLYALF